jgi:hypothetical protein
MKPTELRRGDIIVFNYGDEFPHVEMVVVGVDSDRTGFFALAIDDAGVTNRVYDDGIEDRPWRSMIGWKLIARMELGAS